VERCDGLGLYLIHYLSDGVCALSDLGFNVLCVLLAGIPAALYVSVHPLQAAQQRSDARLQLKNKTV
jgi:hypothetical protein